MPAFRTRVTVLVDGVPIRGFPLVRRLESPTQAIDQVHLCPVSSSRTVNPSLNAALKVAALTTDQPVTVQLLSQAVGAASTLEAGGLFLAFDSSLTGNIVVTNQGAKQAVVRGIIAS